MTQLPRPCPLCATPNLETWDTGEKLMTDCANPKCSLSKHFMPLDEWNTRPVEDALLGACEAADAVLTEHMMDPTTVGIQTHVLVDLLTTIEYAIARAKGQVT